MRRLHRNKSVRVRNQADQVEQHEADTAPQSDDAGTVQVPATTDQEPRILGGAWGAFVEPQA